MAFNRVSLLALSASLLLAAEVASAQSVGFGPKRSTVSGGTINVSLSVPAAVTGDGTLSVTYAGDLGSATEVITVSVEGVPVGTLNGGADCVLTYTQDLTIDAAVLAAAAADGSVDISFQAAPFVDNFCGQPSLDFDPGGPFAIYNNQVPGASIAVLGSLAYTESAPAPAGAAETTMMANRGALILSNGLDTRQRIERLQNGTAVSRETLSFEDVPLVTGSPVGLALDEDRMNFVAGADWGGTMVWAEGSIATLNDDATDDARFAILHIGADWLLNADTSLGVAAQFDSYSENDFISGAEFSGRGWMIGPVLTSRIADRLFLDARLAYGRADNDARRSGGTDEFDSERALAELSVTGQLSHGGYSIFPDAEIAYFSETSDSYSSATLGQVDGKRVSLGQARLGALIERPFEMSANGTAIAFADFGSVYTRRYEGSLIEGAFADEIEGWSGEAELGLRYTSRGGASLDASIGVGGLFANAESYSATLAVRIPLP